jgi:decaprenyl-phosphate phosphoribosyltransferase
VKEQILNLLSLIRIKHWLKNGFVFLPAFFAAHAELIYSTNLIFVFFSFCLASSSIYVFNDILDVERDRVHPLKKKRPLATGFYSIKFGWFLFSGLTLLFLLSLLNISNAGIYIFMYFVLNIIYSLHLKNISIIDVASISLGFVLRVLAGGFSVGVYVSHWMIIMVFLLTISIAFAKRRDDLVIDIAKSQLRKSFSGYSLSFLDIATTVSMTITLVAYILYSVSGEVIERIGSDKLYITSLFVFLGIMRYLQIMIIDRNSGSPIEVLWKDRFLQIVVILWGLVISLIIYG